MLSIKKVGTGVLACTLVLSMAACQSRGTGPAPTTIATMPEAQTKTTVAAVQTQGAEDLTKVLDQIAGNVFPGHRRLYHDGGALYGQAPGLVQVHGPDGK